VTAPAAQTLIGAAHAAVVRSPEFWIAYYAGQAQSSPLPANHPFASTIARDPRSRCAPRESLSPMPTVKVLTSKKLEPAAIAAKVAAATGAPPAAAHIAVTKVLMLHLAAPSSPEKADAASDLAALDSPDAKALAGAAHAAVVQDSAFWVTYYATQAQTKPLPPTHPWAGLIARELVSP